MPINTYEDLQNENEFLKAENERVKTHRNRLIFEQALLIEAVHTMLDDPNDRKSRQSLRDLLKILEQDPDTTTVVEFLDATPG